MAWTILLPSLPLLDARAARLLPARWSARLAQLAPEPAHRLGLPLIVALVDLPVQLWLSSLSGNNFAHYFMMPLPAVTILVAFAVYALQHMLHPALGQPMRRVWLLLLLLPVFLPGMYETRDRIGPYDDRQVRQVVDYIQANSQPGDRVLQWGTAAMLNLLSERDTPTRYFFADPLFVDGYSGLLQSQTLLRELQAHPPLLIINEGMVNLPLITADPQHCSQVRDPNYYQAVLRERQKIKVDEVIPDMPEGMGDVYEWICQNYIPQGPVGELGWNVYRLKGK